MEDMILSVNHLSKSFGAHKVLADVDFEVKKQLEAARRILEDLRESL